METARKLSKAEFNTLLMKMNFSFQFEEFLKDQLPKLKGMIMSRVSSLTETEDIIGDILLGAWIMISSGNIKRPNINLKTIIYIITKRRIMDYYRRKYRLVKEYKRSVMQYNEEYDQDFVRLTSDERGLFDRWSVIEEKAIKRLTANEKIMLQMFIGGLSSAEIAQVKGISKRWASACINSAKRKVLAAVGTSRLGT